MSRTPAENRRGTANPGRGTLVVALLLALGVTGSASALGLSATGPASALWRTSTGEASGTQQSKTDGTLGKSPDWTPPATDVVRSAAMSWLDAREVDEPTRRRAEEIWRDMSVDSAASDRLAALAMTIALAEPRADRLVRFCAAPRGGVELPDAAWLAEPDVAPLVSANLRLLVGRWLVQESLFDEALAQLGDLQPQEVVDPASLLFCQAVAHHQLLHKEAGLRAIDRLLSGRDQAPRRYTALATLMRGDLQGVTEDSLDHIARRMEDIERRLDLGRAGPKVRGIEDGVIRSLDKLIEELEEQQKQSQATAADTLQSSRPADDSRLMGGLGEGRVTQKNLGDKSGWGNLPPKEREEALQEIARQFPAHYRDVIEQYFRKMAAEESTYHERYEIHERIK